MKCRQSFNWRKAVFVDAESLRSFVAVVDDFIAQSIVDAVVGAGFNPADIKNFGDCALFAAGKEPSEMSRISNLAYTLRKIQKVDWSVRLRSGVRINNLNIDQVISLPNVDQRSLSSVVVGNDSSEYGMNIEWTSESYLGAVSVTISGPLVLVEHFEGEIRHRLASITSGWSVLQNSAVKLVLYIILIFIPMLYLVEWVLVPKLFGGLKARLGSDYGLLTLVTDVTLMTLVAPLVVLGDRLINWLIPKVEFRIGGGAALARVKQSARQWALGAPLVSFAIPLLINWISTKLFR